MIAGRARLAAATAVCLVAIAACHRSSPSTSPPASRPLRIVSLSPAISRTLVDLGLASCVVGRTPYCSAIEQSIPIAGDLQSIDYETLVRLSPTHILLQPPAAGVDPHLVRIAGERGWTIADWRLNGLEDIKRMLREIPDRVAARTETARHAADILAQLDAALSVHADEPLYSGRTLMLNAVDPVMAFGSGTYLDDVLRALGGTNALADRGWVQLSLEDVARLSPEAIILVKPQADDGDAAKGLGPLMAIEAPAIVSGRWAILTHPDAFLPSSGVVGVARELRAMLREFAERPVSSDNRR